MTVSKRHDLLARIGLDRLQAKRIVFSHPALVDESRIMKVSRRFMDGGQDGTFRFVLALHGRSPTKVLLFASWFRFRIDVAANRFFKAENEEPPIALSRRHLGDGTAQAPISQFGLSHPAIEVLGLEDPSHVK